MPTRVEDREDVVLLDELSRQLHGLRRVVRVVEVDVVDLPAVDAAVSVDVLEVRVGAVRDRAEERRRPGDRDRAADRDRRRRDARLAARERGGREQRAAPRARASARLIRSPASSAPAGRGTRSERDRPLVAESEVRHVGAPGRRAEDDRETRALRQVLHVVREPDRLQPDLRHDRAVCDHPVAGEHRRDEARIVRDLRAPAP